MPSKDKGKRRGIEKIGFGEKRARKKQRSFYVNEIEDKILEEEQKKLGFESFREYVMTQLHFCRRYDKGEEVLKERIDAMLKNGEGLKEEKGIDPRLHPEIAKQTERTAIRYVTDYCIILFLLQHGELTYEQIREAVESFLREESFELDESMLEDRLFALRGYGIVVSSSQSDEVVEGMEKYALRVVRDLANELVYQSRQE